MTDARKTSRVLPFQHKKRPAPRVPAAPEPKPPGGLQISVTVRTPWTKDEKPPEPPSS